MELDLTEVTGVTVTATTEASEQRNALVDFVLEPTVVESVRAWFDSNPGQGIPVLALAQAAGDDESAAGVVTIATKPVSNIATTANRIMVTRATRDDEVKKVMTDGYSFVLRSNGKGKTPTLLLTSKRTKVQGLKPRSEDEE